MIVDGHMHLNGTLQDPTKYPPLKDQPHASQSTAFGWFGAGDRPDGDASIEALRERMAATPGGVQRAVSCLLIFR